MIALAPLLSLALTAVALLWPAAVGRPRAAALISACGFALALVWVGLPAGPEPQFAAALLRIDAYARSVIALVAGSGLVASLLSRDYFAAPCHRAEAYLLLATAALGGAVLAAADHFASLFLGVELMGVSLAVLNAWPFTRPALEAGIKYLILSGTASALMAFGMALAYADSGSMAFSALHPAGLGGMGLVLILAGLGFKLSWVPFHLWAADVYQGAPAPVAAFLASASKSAAMAVVVRLLLESGAWHNARLAWLLAAVAGLSILVGSLMALLQNRLKRLLAYSAIAHFGYLLIVPAAAGVLGTELATEVVLFYLASYTLAVLLAFGLISACSREGVEPDALADWRGLIPHRPLAAALLTVALLSLAGLPVTVGFVGKFYLFAAAVGAGLWPAAGALLIGSGLGMYYYLRVILELGRPGEPPPAPLPATSLALLGVLGLGVVGLGIQPSPLIAWAGHPRQAVRAQVPSQPSRGSETGPSGPNAHAPAR